MKHFVRTGADEAIIRVTIHNKPFKVGGRAGLSSRLGAVLLAVQRLNHSLDQGPS